MVLYKTTMHIPDTKQLISDIEAFCDENDIAPTTFCKTATGNVALLNKLKKGRSPSIETAKKVYDYMALYNDLIST